MTRRKVLHPGHDCRLSGLVPRDSLEREDGEWFLHCRLVAGERGMIAFVGSKNQNERPTDSNYEAVLSEDGVRELHKALGSFIDEWDLMDGVIAGDPDAVEKAKPEKAVAVLRNDCNVVQVQWRPRLSIQVRKKGQPNVPWIWFSRDEIRQLSKMLAHAAENTTDEQA